MSDLQVVLHLSSTAVQTVFGYAEGTPEQPKVKVVAAGLARTDAFEGGKISSREHLVSAIHKSLQEAGNMAGMEAQEVTLSFASPLMTSMNDLQQVLVHGTTVQRGDIHRASEMSAQALRDEGYKVLQSCQQIVYLEDGQESKNPVNMYADRIDVANHVMALPINYQAQVLDAVRASEISVDTTLFDGVVSAEYALSVDEKKQGVCFIDIGHSTTKVCVYADGILLFSECFDVGGQTVTYDIASELKLSIADAESLKRQEGTLKLDPAKRATFVTLRRRMGGDESTISLRRLSNIIAARYDDIFTRISQRLEAQRLSGLLTCGVVLAGGGCLIDGLTYFLGRQWGLPVRMMSVNPHVSICPKNLTDDNILLLNSYLADNKLHSVIGALLYQNSEQFLKDNYVEVQPENNLVHKVSGGWQAFASRIKDWF